MIRRSFDFVEFCARVGAGPKEVSVLRHALVRGLKDYYELTYGYDRYGAETLFRVKERMAEPYVFGFACGRILRDRRISAATKTATAELAVDMVQYGSDGGVPYAVLDALRFLSEAGTLSAGGLRFGLVAIAGESAPFRGLSRGASLSVLRCLLRHDGIPPSERLLWAHSLLARAEESTASSEMVLAVLADASNPHVERSELCHAWLHCRQPRLEVEMPEVERGTHGEVVAHHMPFWIAHTPSWPTPAMVRMGLVWLARQADSPADLARQYVTHGGQFENEIKSAVLQILEEYGPTMPTEEIEGIIEGGITSTGATSLRRKFYGIGTALCGESYLERATCDPANSVRQWAVRQRQKSGP